MEAYSKVVAGPGDGESRSSSEYILEVELTGLADA